jgi:hypothetical protein
MMAKRPGSSVGIAMEVATALEQQWPIVFVS